MSFTIIRDSREQLGYRFEDYDCKVMDDSLTTGDYSILHLRDYITVERKELSDFISIVTTGRKRFSAEMHRMQSYKGKAVVIESDIQDIVTHNYRSKVAPNAVLSSLASWTTMYGVPFIFAGTKDNAERITFYILLNFYKRMQRFCEQLIINEFKGK